MRKLILLTTLLVAMLLAVAPALAQSGSASKSGSASGDSAAPDQPKSGLPLAGESLPLVLVSLAVPILGTAVGIVLLRWRSNQRAGSGQWKCDRRSLASTSFAKRRVW